MRAIEGSYSISAVPSVDEQDPHTASSNTMSLRQWKSLGLMTRSDRPSRLGGIQRVERDAHGTTPYSTNSSPLR